MLRAGAVGYLVKGTAGDEIVGSIEKVMAGGASLSSEVIAGIVLRAHPAAAARGQRARDARRAARRDRAVRRRRRPLHGLPAHHGARDDARPSAWRRSHDSTRCRFGRPTNGSPKPSRTRWASSSRSRPSPRRWASLERIPERRLPGGQLLAPRRDLAAVHPHPGAARRAPGAGDHRARGGGGLRRLGAVARAAAGPGRPRSRSTTPVPGSRACDTRCASPPTS